jgi:UDP-3-O-[3-hydroxymyristoyl] glucosamine N-acyltransferase
VSALGTLGDVAQRTGGRVIGDTTLEMMRVAGIDDADSQTLTFASDARYLRAALASSAGAILVEEELLDATVTYAKPLVAVPSVRLALSAVLAVFAPPRPAAGIHPSAVIDPTAILGSDVSIGPQVCVGARTHIGAGGVLLAGAIVGNDVTMGEQCFLHPRAVVLDGSRLGDRVVLHPGATIGSEGFGWAFEEGALRKIAQVGIVVLGNDVEIGVNTCVDRAQTGVTSIGEGTKIDNLVQIGHNSRIGKHCVFAAMTGLAGSTVIGDYVQVGGQCGFRGHITVGSRVVIAAGTDVWGNVEDGAKISGRPAQNHRDEVRGQALRRKLPNLFARVDALERAAQDGGAAH